MPLPWYITTSIQLAMSPWALLMPFILVMEAYRGAFLSATSMGIFVEEGSVPILSVARDLATMRLFLDDMQAILDSIPSSIRPILGPWYDYQMASECFYQILKGKQEAKGMPTTCDKCWLDSNHQ